VRRSHAPRLTATARSFAAVGALVGLAAVAACAPDGTPASAADAAEPSLPAVASQEATPGTPPTANSAVQGRAAAVSSKVASALRLAHQYEHAAFRISRLRSLPGHADSALVSALWQTAHAYRIAATAAADGDVVGYQAAMRAAAIGRQKARLAGVPARRSHPATPRRTTPTRPRPHPCGGDSISDDPSDDDCGG
jgi:hypothetical protein